MLALLTIRRSRSARSILLSRMHAHMDMSCEAPGSIDYIQICLNQLYFKLPCPLIIINTQSHTQLHKITLFRTIFIPVGARRRSAISWYGLQWNELSALCVFIETIDEFICSARENTTRRQVNHMWPLSVAIGVNKLHKAIRLIDQSKYGCG